MHETRVLNVGQREHRMVNPREQKQTRSVLESPTLSQEAHTSITQGRKAWPEHGNLMQVNRTEMYSFGLHS